MVTWWHHHITANYFKVDATGICSFSTVIWSGHTGKMGQLQELAAFLLHFSLGVPWKRGRISCPIECFFMLLSGGGKGTALLSCCGLQRKRTGPSTSVWPLPSWPAQAWCLHTWCWRVKPKQSSPTPHTLPSTSVPLCMVGRWITLDSWKEEKKRFLIGLISKWLVIATAQNLTRLNAHMPRLLLQCA